LHFEKMWTKSHSVVGSPQKSMNKSGFLEYFDFRIMINDHAKGGCAFGAFMILEVLFGKQPVFSKCVAEVSATNNSNTPV
jgi:hypothetical protein